jgi:hypothetical protein
MGRWTLETRTRLPEGVMRDRFLEHEAYREDDYPTGSAAAWAVLACFAFVVGAVVIAVRVW